MQHIHALAQVLQFQFKHINHKNLIWTI